VPKVVDKTITKAVTLTATTTTSSSSSNNAINQHRLQLQAATKLEKRAQNVQNV